MGRQGLAALCGLVFATAFLGLLVSRAPASPQENEEQAENEEVVANLATGQVEIYVGRDGVAIGVLGNAFEPDSHPPLVAQLATGQVAILLGAVDWFYPASHRHVRLDARLPQLMAAASAGARPHLEGAPAEDSTVAGLALLEPVRKLAGSLHAAVELPDRAPLVEMVLLSYDRSEGARISDLQYQSKQQALRGDFWQTVVDRPKPSQLYPPVHGVHGRPIELSYPTGSSPAMAELLANGDSRITPVASRTEDMARVASKIEHGETQKALAHDLADFLRAALPAFAKAAAGEPASAKATAGRPAPVAAVGVLDESGFRWVLPPPETEQPGKEEREAGSEPRSPGAPTLRKKPPE